MKSLRKLLDALVLTSLFILGSATIALEELAWRPVASFLSRCLGRPVPRPDKARNLPDIIIRAFFLIAISAIVGLWLLRDRCPDEAGTLLWQEANVRRGRRDDQRDRSAAVPSAETSQGEKGAVRSP